MSASVSCPAGRSPLPVSLCVLLRWVVFVSLCRAISPVTPTSNRGSARRRKVPVGKIRGPQRQVPEFGAERLALQVQ